ncbi:hypothetical protein EDD16DRAFT_314691 [Pisolithus croceorrhizus]|nr:hypothetical protein EDD16DRAFT_314691 [Pisolithus croceorrhizus]
MRTDLTLGSKRATLKTMAFISLIWIIPHVHAVLGRRFPAISLAEKWAVGSIATNTSWERVYSSLALALAVCDVR